MESLFSSQADASRPLAERLRPKTLAEVAGQDHLVPQLQKLLDAEGMLSFILWGPPGTGKTTLARIFAEQKDAQFVALSAVSDGVKKIREVAAEAADRLRTTGRRTIVFIDEIHALKKTQQDVLLPLIEGGVFYLIGATTENPGFTLNSALLSRVRVFLLKALDDIALQRILRSAADYLRVELSPETEQFLIAFANRDARLLLNVLEEAILSGKGLDPESLTALVSEKTLRYDRDGDEHYLTISAFIKSMRASDPDAAVYYLARMLRGGEDPRFIARRMVIFASEDIGLADPRGLLVASAAQRAAETIGMPEIRINLAHAAIFLSTCPKDNSAYLAIDAALAEVDDSGNLPIPLHLRNASNQLLKTLGYGSGYLYPHDGSKNTVNLPEPIKTKRFFEPKSGAGTDE